MKQHSTRQAAQKLGIGHSTLAHYVEEGKLPTPGHIMTGGRRVHVWSEEDIAKVQQLLPKIANGRKTRYSDKHSAVSTQQPVKTKKKKTKK